MINPGLNLLGASADGTDVYTHNHRFYGPPTRKAGALGSIYIQAWRRLDRTLAAATVSAADGTWEIRGLPAALADEDFVILGTDEFGDGLGSYLNPQMYDRVKPVA